MLCAYYTHIKYIYIEREREGELRSSIHFNSIPLACAPSFPSPSLFVLLLYGRFSALSRRRSSAPTNGSTQKEAQQWKKERKLIESECSLFLLLLPSALTLALQWVVNGKKFSYIRFHFISSIAITTTSTTTTTSNNNTHTTTTNTNTQQPVVVVAAACKHTKRPFVWEYQGKERERGKKQ